MKPRVLRSGLVLLAVGSGLAWWSRDQWAVGCAKSGQQTPDGFYNLERMLKPVVRREQVVITITLSNAYPVARRTPSALGHL